MAEREDDDMRPPGADDTAPGADDTDAGTRRSVGERVRAAGGALGRAARSRAGRRTRITLGVLAVSVVGVVLGVLLGAHTKVDIGPFNAQMTIRPSLTGGTDVVIPPLGSLLLDSHDGPAHLSVQLGTLDQRRTKALIDDPAGIARASETAVHDVTRGIVRLGVRTLAFSVLCTLLLAALVFRNVRRVAWSGLLSLVITGGSLGIGALTLRTSAIEEPRYEGLLVNAPAVVGDARRIANDYNMYAEQLQRLVGNVSRIYTTVSTLPLYDPAPGTKRVLHVSDLHLNPTAWQMIRTIVEQFNIDAVIDTGDITDWGSEPEGSFVSAIGALRVPYIYIRGNHDSARTAASVASQRNAIVLNNSMTTVAGLTIAGIGDPRFTPDKETSPAGSGLTKPVAEQVIGAGERLANTVRSAGHPVDIALVHDPESAGPLSGVCPLVLAGHVHARQTRMLAQVPGQQPTRLLVEGSSGGAGLRGLEGEAPTPLAMSVLYFGADRALQAYDDIVVGGTGRSQVTLERHVVNEKKLPNPSPTVATPTPTRTR
ncbi:Predicted phosphohydrolase, MPP superfamily [Micromonospora pattaloongensis]|uniref:Predicted phosphohydrolase, MPP superfamily n=1 Tax=Micromonospora pattaloongensis TaxID=405436 RepID=A0A1H3KY68_9ACTN|nr:metallophosphoesterase [Micromonospora pattaloongensis]SDY56939.1 Predicted phosphohydrolase, MPP superfamily [Micromonospora pattaloongensis]